MNEEAEDILGSPGSGPPEAPFWERYAHLRPYLWQNRIAPAFWTTAGILSLALNVALIVLLVILGRELFTLKRVVSDQLVEGLRTNFERMDEAVITAQVPVEDQIPVQFVLPVETETQVTLTEDTLLQGARVDLRTGGLRIIDAPADIVLKAGTALPVALNIDVPVDTEIPIQLMVDVTIPLEDTELHDPFVGLQQVVMPYDQLLSGAPDSWGELVCAGGEGLICRLVTEEN